MSFGFFFRSPRWSLEVQCVDGWFRCLGCFRFFTKRVDELYCYDCCKELRER